MRHRWRFKRQFPDNPERLRFELDRLEQRYYLAYFMDMRCNYNCSYCIQSGIQRGGYSRIPPDEVITYLLEHAQRKERCLGIVGGEATVNPEFRRTIEKLHQTFSITVTTNLGSKLFEDMDAFLEWAVAHPIEWHASFHAEFMDPTVFVSRVRRMQEAGLVCIPEGVDTEGMSEKQREIILGGGIGFQFQVFLGSDAEGNLVPREHPDPSFSYDRYKAMCGGNPRPCTCRTVTRSRHARHLIAPDGSIYNCHQLLYRQLNPVGHIRSGWPKGLLDWQECNLLGDCNPCDMGDMEFREAPSSGAS